MFKKFISMATAAILFGTGLSMITIAPASATGPDITNFVVGCSSGPSIGQPTSGVSCANALFDRHWNLSNPIWSPTVSNGFLANTVYSVTYTLTGALTQSGQRRVPTTSANAFTIDTSYAGSPAGTTVTSLASNAGDSSMTITITFPSLSLLQGRVVSSSSTLRVGQVNPTIVVTSNASLQPDASLYELVGLSSVGLTQATYSSTGPTLSISLTGTVTAGTLTFQIKATNIRLASNTLSFVASGTSTPSSPAEIAAAAVAAAQAAEAAAAAARAAEAVIRAAEVNAAQNSLATALRGDKPGTLSEYRAANINITTTAGLTRLNAEVLKLTGADRTDFAKIRAIADRIEFDESFFNTAARPSLATYAKYEVVGVTERILPVVNAKVLELPAALRLDVKAMQDLVRVENFVDRVANPTTRSTVTSSELVSRGLLKAEYPRKHSVTQGLSRYPEGSLNTIAKIEAAIKAEIAKAEAPRLRLAEIKARMAARKK